MTAFRGATVAWAAYACAAGVVSAFALLAWARALALAGPVLYGEGAVAHAALLARTLDTYRDPVGAAFTAANYPPLYVTLASVGDPFVTGRVLSIVATLAVAGLVAWRAREAPPLVRAALAAGWLALVPVAIWGPAVKPDLLALALTVAAVIMLERRRAGLAAALLVLAIAAKPTAILPALVLLGWIVARDRALLRPFAVFGAIALAVAGIACIPFGYDGLWRHVVGYNALPWTAEQAALLAFVAVAVEVALLGGGLATRGFAGPIGAYAVAAVGVVVLGGREGATINYVLDLGAAASLALASRGRDLARTPLYPVAAIVNLVIAVALFDPLGIVPGRTASTGSWGDGSRITAAKEALAGDETILAEDSGLLIATGHRVAVDDLFLWSRLVANGTIDPSPVLGGVEAARFTAIVSEVELSRLGDAAAYERSRWDPALVRAVDERYRLAARVGGLFVYRPR